MNLRHTITITALLSTALLPLHPAAQRTVEVKESINYEVSIDDNITMQQAKINAIQLAITTALEKKFGRTVIVDINSRERQINDETDVSITSDTRSMVKGEWLSDIKPPRVTVSCVEGNKLIFTAEVWGKAREIVRAKTNIKYKVFKGTGDTRVESNQFDSGDRLYLTFETPINGYVAAYLITDDEEVSCLLPYRSNNDGTHYVQRGRQYTFFDKQTDKTAVHYRLKALKQSDPNQLVVIFSPQKFTKCLETSKDPKQPATLKRKAFSDWLIENQTRDKDMIVKYQWLTIESKEQ